MTGRSPKGGDALGVAISCETFVLCWLDIGILGQLAKGILQRFLAEVTAISARRVRLP